MTTVGYALVIFGGLFISIGGFFFYNYFQQILSASVSSAAGSTSNVANALSIYNGTADMPIFVTFSIFGLAFLVMGAIFVAGGHISEHLAVQTMNPAPMVSEDIAPRPSRACTKCGSLIYLNSAYCPNCGNPLGRVQSVPAPAT